jgi:hypothetical protein
MHWEKSPIANNDADINWVIFQSLLCFLVDQPFMVAVLFEPPKFPVNQQNSCSNQLNPNN